MRCETVAAQQDTGALLFSTLTELMSEAVLHRPPAVPAADQARAGDVPVSDTAVDHKLQRLERPIGAEWVPDSSRQAEPVVRQLRASEPSWRTGDAVRVIDGNPRVATDQRVKELRRTGRALGSFV